MFWVESVCLSACLSHSWAPLFGTFFSKRNGASRPIQNYHVKAHRSNGNNKGSVFSCGQNFRRKWRLKVRASDISHKLSVHFSPRGTVLAGHYLYHVKAHALNGNNKVQFFRAAKISVGNSVWKWVQ